jgi:hypothetical protein
MAAGSAWAGVGGAPGSRFKSRITVSPARASSRTSSISRFMNAKPRPRSATGSGCGETASAKSPQSRTEKTNESLSTPAAR